MRRTNAYGSQLVIGWLLILNCVPASGQSPAEEKPQRPGGELGSTLTVEQLNAKPKQIAAEAIIPIEVQPAGEPVPALKYRFRPSIRELKPGSALLHFSRAMLMLKDLPVELRRKVEAGPDEPKPSPADEQMLLSAAAQMFHELHELALSEDFAWDHRMRDLRGPAVYSYVLPDVQEARSLARLLRRRIDDQLGRGDFAGALESIEDGYRLAEFMANGETLVQQLVALAIGEVMRDAAQTAVTKPGCPNLYWALASVPPDAAPMRRSLDFELSSFESVFEMLAEAEAGAQAGAGDEAYWQKRLQDLLASMRELNDSNDDLSFSITVAAMMASPRAKEQLIEAGWKKEVVEAMPPTRALLINTRRELRRWADQVEKISLLPYAFSSELRKRTMNEFMIWARENRYKSLGASIAALLFPAVDSVRLAVVRQQFQHNRLMVLEALRMHAADHQRQLPRSLEALEPVPALLNPFNNQPFGYAAKRTRDGVNIELTAEVPSQYNFLKQLNVVFKDTTLAP